VVWGKSDNIRVTDVLNPLDMREPGLTDLEDLRLPLAMARMDYYFGDWQLSGMAIPEIRFNKTPGFGSDFFPSPVPLPPETVPSDGGANTEWAAALSGVFSGWDAALYAARLFDDQTHVSMLPGTARARLTREHARLTMLGAAVNVARGNWIYKAETAWLDGLEFFNAPGADFSRIDALAGMEYAGFGEATVSLEIANRRLIGYEERLRSAPDSVERYRFQYALRATRDYLNDTLTLTALALVYGAEGEDGALGRLTAEYDVTDAWTVTAGVVSYQAGELPTFADIGDNDRFFLELKLSF